ncbi:MAG: methyl-accepting chemotaxis protein [Clostridium sp.]|nr:methyl-accepting chemotaxis protein [Clostridium sp. DSM 8431]MCR4943724.1 methyl-accepting chemotaxis protein [Clostridium sp.]SFU48833.1 methyl-accepting chemotaxis sensory transducer with Cache sensor [Clostridium sp. DSM 8431]
MKKLKTKFIRLNIVIVIAVAIATGSLSVIFLNKNNKNTMTNYEEALKDGYDNVIKYQVENVISLLNGIYNKQINGQLSEDEAKEEAKNLVKSLRYNEDGYFCIYSTDGTLIAHPMFPEQEGIYRLNEVDKNGVKFIQNIIKIAAIDKGGFTEFYYSKPGQDEAAPKRVYSELFNPYGWVITTGNYIDDIDVKLAEKEKDLNATIMNTNIGIVIISFILMSISTGIAVKFSDKLLKPITGIKDFAERLAKYDFSKELEINDETELGKTAEALNLAQSNIKKLIKKISDCVEDLTSSAEDLSRLSTDVNNKVDIVSDFTNEIVNNMSDSKHSVDEVHVCINEITSSVSDLASKSTDSSGISIDFKEKSLKLKEKTTSALNNTEGIYNEKEKKILESIKYGEVVKEVSATVDEISDIAEETNMLALNAAIESARVGEAGRGFAVVSEEVRQLAEQSSSSAESIQETVAKIEHAFMSLSKDSKEILDFMSEDVKKQFNEFILSGEYYYENAEKISSISEDIAAMSEELSASMEEINSMISSMAENTEKSTDNSSKILVKVRETSNAMEEVAVTAEKQNVLAKELNKLIKDFKI